MTPHARRRRTPGVCVWERRRLQWSWQENTAHLLRRPISLVRTCIHVEARFFRTLARRRGSVLAGRHLARRGIAASSQEPRLRPSPGAHGRAVPRGGRVAAVTGGVIGQPGTFYIGMPLGGVWKTTSAGTVWYPVMDGVKEASSVGSVQVAPSDPNIVYSRHGRPDHRRRHQRRKRHV